MNAVGLNLNCQKGVEGLGTRMNNGGSGSSGSSRLQGKNRSSLEEEKNYKTCIERRCCQTQNICVELGGSEGSLTPKSFMI